MGLFEQACSPNRRTRIIAKAKVIGGLLAAEALMVLLFLTDQDPSRMVVQLIASTVLVAVVSVMVWTTR